MRSMFVLLAAFAASFACLPAQGVVNPTLLRAPDPGTPPADGTAALVAAARAAVVHVYVEVDGPRGTFALERHSSGVVVDRGGLVLTWKHLVQEFVGAVDKTLFVQLDDARNTALPAAVVRIDDATGLALLRVTPPAEGLVALSLGSDRPGAGVAVVVLARPEGRDMLAFAGVASPALAATRHRGVTWQPAACFLTDSRNDERCDGGAVVDGRGQLVGLYGADNVQRDTSEPTLEDLKRPSFGIVAAAGTVRRTFAAEFAAAGKVDQSLLRAPGATLDIGAAAVARVAPAVVGVWAGEGDWPALGEQDPGAVQRRDGLGSGLVLTADGLVVTNRHLVEGKAPRLRTGDGRTIPAEVVRGHGATNLALLRAQLPDGLTLPVPTFAGELPLVGETMFAVGNPTGSAVTVSRGVVSALRGRAGGRIQADANLGNQNAGGAIVDVAGRVLGIGDGGAVDPIDMQFAMRGDRATTETNLSTFVGIEAVRGVFAAELEATVSAAPATEGELASKRSRLAAMVEQASGAMLNIYVAKNVAEVDPDDPFASMAEPVLRVLGLGSGVIIDRSGLALSNWHVVDSAVGPDGAMRPDHAVTARVFGGRSYEVRVLSISREDDLSLLQLVLPPGQEVDAVELGSSDGLLVGEAVAAIGNPHGRANTVTYGVVSAKEQATRVRGRWAKLEHLIETDAAINGGNSGGALLDMQGRLVGINSAGGGTFNNKGYAIAVDHVRRQVLALLLQAYKLRSPDLGLRVIDDEGEVVVMDVDDRGPAAAAGVRSGDRIVSLAGVDITWSPGFALTLLRQQADVACDLVVERRGERKTFRVAPVANAVWSVVRQSNLRCRTFGYREDPERVRAAVIALHRKLTGDPEAEPNSIPEFVVAVDAVFAAPGATPIALQKGDLMLAVELRDAETGDRVQRRIAGLEALRDLFNDRLLGTYEGVDWTVWIARGAEVEKVKVRAKRLFW